MSAAGVPIRVSIEIGAKRVFASALDWPGWSRGAGTEPGSLAALVGHAARYASVLAFLPGAAGFRAPVDGAGLVIVERLVGGPATDFGVPSVSGPLDAEPLAGPELERQAAILRACWDAFDRACTVADGVTLRTGPRGGGRSLEKIIEHVVDAEAAYLTQLGARPPREPAGPAARAPALRALVETTFRARAGGAPPTTAVRRPWSPRYFVRRAAWHILDHAWELEDRTASA